MSNQLYPIDKIVELLLYKKEDRLANLLTASEYDFYESSTYGSQYMSYLTTVNIYSPLKYHEKLKTLSKKEKEIIIDAFRIIYPVKSEAIEINNIEFFPHPENYLLKEERPLIPKPGIIPDYWKEGFYKVFISHSSKIKAKANKLKEALYHYSMSGFVAHEDIEPTKEWQLVIENALSTCDAVVPLINEDFPNSLWTDQEVGIGYALRKTIIPVRLGMDPYGFMGKFQGLQGTNKKDLEIAEEIFKLLINSDENNERISKAIIIKFINSSSFREAIDTMDLLQHVTFINEDLLEKLRIARENNDQIYKSIGVPGRLEHFIKNCEKKLKA
jgi:TIR domain